ncbi:MAG TPA: DUF418 domain-containing protein [Sphingomicrobium sp.]|nr:DUF418 domain-containing protein [Sphingomicrobium sp.]
MDSKLQAIDRIRGSERIASLDIIRGIAILFILFMNIPAMGGYEFLLWDPRHPTWTTADYWATLITRIWLEGTQRGLLELLFGAGIMIMARKAMTADGPVEVADLHFRRNIWLCLFGLANAFVLMWFGDILLVYGLAAVFLFPLRKLGPRSQCAFAALFLAILLAWNVKNYVGESARLQQAEKVAAAAQAGDTLSKDDKERLKEYRERVERRTQLPADNAKAREKITKADKARHSTFLAYWNAQFEGWMFIMTQFFWVIEAEIVATMLIGMALYQWGIIQGRARPRTYWAFLVLGYGIGMALRGSYWVERLDFGPPAVQWEDVLADISRLAVTFGHIGLVHLLLGSATGQRLLRPFVAAGRMPLSVYLFTSFLMMWVMFAPWGLGLFGAWGMAKLMGVAALVIAAELVAANVWLRRYENGPMEWLWKSLAYQRREPFRRARLESPGPMPSPA